LNAQLFRLQAALDDVVSHMPDDPRTRALVAEVETVRNGQPGPVVRLRAEKP
jgi:capsule polysaccharide export protein KpsE/RkpR